MKLPYRSNVGAAASTATGCAGGAAASLALINAAISGVSAQAPAALVPYAATQVAAAGVGITGTLGGPMAVSSLVASVGGPLVLATGGVLGLVAVGGGLAYGLFRLVTRS